MSYRIPMAPAQTKSTTVSETGADKETGTATETETAADKETGTATERETASATPSTPSPMVYVPPSRGAPGHRIGGGTRIAGQDSCHARIEALVPESPAGLTVRAHPILQWYLFNKLDCRVDFVLVDRRESRPLVETTLERPMEPGVHQIDLSRVGVQLEPGVEYEWFVAIVHDPERRSRDSVAGGQVIRRAITDGAEAGESANGANMASFYAQQGIWYDALAALTAGIEAQPENSKLREQRAMLLDQVGLADVAARERAAMIRPR
jgi:hypothetical protein